MQVRKIGKEGLYMRLYWLKRAEGGCESKSKSAQLFSVGCVWKVFISRALVCTFVLKGYKTKVTTKSLSCSLYFIIWHFAVDFIRGCRCAGKVD